MATTFEEEDDIMLPLSEEPSSPVRPKLKRLKKASERQPRVHLPDLPPVNQNLPPDSSEQALDPLFPDSAGLIDELRKEKSDQVIEDEPLLPDSLEKEHIVEDDSLDPLFPDSSGLIEELRRERLEETKIRGQNLTNLEDEYLGPDPDSLEKEHIVEDDSLDPLFPDSSGLIEELRRERLEETKIRGPNLTNLEDESPGPDLDEPNDGLDPLFQKPGDYKAWEGEDIGEGGLIEVLRQEKSAKRCLNLDAEDEPSEKETKKKKRKSSEKSNFKQKESVRDKKRFEKGRRVQLDQLHAESQRLLRETSDASFKPRPAVHKPISSVLEKIRLRKLEILKTSSMSFQTAETDSSVGVDSRYIDAPGTQNMTKDDVNFNMGNHDGEAMDARNSENHLEDENDNESHDNRETGAKEHVPNLDNSESTSNVDKSGNAHSSNKVHSQSDDIADDEMKSVLGSCMPCTSPALESDDESSSSSSDDDDDDDEEEEEEEYNDKENIDPCPQDLYPTVKNSKSTLLKDFVDDEAEEEDDSDHDMTRFPENEEDGDDDDGSDENEVLKDLIATGYKEGKRDHESRNELHLKWLQQQDAAETDNVLQRLKYGNVQKEDLMDEVKEDDEEEGEGEGEGGGSGDDVMLSDTGAGAGGLKNILRQNSEKVKKMMMFNDDHDVYVTSDEDENEDYMLRRRIPKQADTKVTSPLEDEESKEVFGLIKKLNIAPPPKRRANQAPSNLDMLTLGGNSKSFSKFFGRKASGGAIPSSRKTVIGRSFIFGRDDSNSRSGLSSDNQSSENHEQSNADPKEKNLSRKLTSANLSSSQLKSATANANSGAGSSSSGSSLFEILRRPSISSDEQTEDKSQLTETQAASVYSAFKAGGRGFSRVDARI